MSEPSHRTVEFETSDGVELVGDLAIPDAPSAAAIICHPHPQYGGNRFNHVVGALFDALPTVGIAALRFDFRATFGNLAGERLDAVAALDELGREVPETALIAVGYSFGAAVTLGLDDNRITAEVLVAPPLAAMDDERVLDVPTLVLTPAHDQFSPPAPNEPIIAAWRSASHEPVDHHEIEMADHFLNGATAEIASRTLAWLANRTSVHGSSRSA